MTENELIKVLSIPSGYATVKLGMSLHPTHQRVLDSLFNNNNTKVSLLAGNATGKTSTVIAASVLYALQMKNALVVATSGVYRQVTGQLVPAIKKYAHLYPKWSFNENSIVINNEKRFIAFASDNEATTQGWHSTPDRPLLFIIDEAAAIHEGLFNAVQRCQATWLLVCGSPLSPQGMLYNIHNQEQFKQFYKCYKLPATDCLKSKGYWIDDNIINEMITMYGPCHPLVLSSVYAEFASTIENGLISLSELDTCYNNPPVFIDNNKKYIGIDVASGGDNCCMAMCIGNKIEIIDIWRESEVMRSCDRIKLKLDDLKEKYGIVSSQVCLDADGQGIGYISRLKDLGWRINEYHGGATADNSQYANNISEDWLTGIMKIKRCSVILPDNQEFKLQLLSRKQLFNDKGKLKLESKKDMKSRGIHSPDIADAVFMSISNNNSFGTINNNYMTTLRHKLIVPTKSYKGYF